MRPRVLVTGGSRGIGAACARRLASDGWDVAVHFNEGVQEAAVVAANAEHKGARAVTVQGDLASLRQCQRVVGSAVEALGGLEAVVANAGIYDRAHLDELPPDRWSRTISVNLTGSFQVLRLASPHLMEAEGASAVLVSSQLARMGSSHGAHYASSKAAIEGLTRALALEMAPHGVRVNCVAPGMTRTAILDDYSEEELGRRAAQLPARRIGEPRDVASAVSFLLSGDASYMTGAVLHVNGGHLMA